MTLINTINLPSFLRRTMKAYALKAHIRELGCELNRIGRSRNWQLKADFSQLQSIIEFIEQEHEESWFWLAKLLKKEYQYSSHENLLQLASRLDNITITALIAKTDCTLAQARKVLDQLEGLD
ncbi:MAG: ribosome recycling factor family protein [Colwellia sp.]